MSDAPTINPATLALVQAALALHAQGELEADTQVSAAYGRGAILDMLKAGGWDYDAEHEIYGRAGDISAWVTLAPPSAPGEDDWQLHLGSL